MDGHPLSAVTIEGFRGFEKIEIPSLGRVNLIVGQNNVGKTALLEALWIYASRNPALTVENILAAREENLSFRLHNGEPNPSYRHIFFQRETENRQIEIGSPKDFPNRLTISQRSGELKISTPMKPPPLNVGGLGNGQSEFKRRTDITSFFVGIHGLEQADVDRLWEKVELTPLEDKILEALRLIVPKIKKVRPRTVQRSGPTHAKVVYAQSEDNVEPLPLRSFGEGLNRLFEIALVLVSCENGVLLIDEIENGLHYSVLPDVWKLIFKTARDLNVQVFATTHSFDCITAFTEAALQDDKSDGLLIRLARHDDQIKAFTFDESQLDTITREGIEVR